MHRNRSLVLNGNINTSSNDATMQGAMNEENSNPSTPGASWVTKTDRHLQLINSSIYEKQSQQRLKAMDDSRRQRLKQRDDREKAKFNKHLSRSGYGSVISNSTNTNHNHEIIVQGISFRVTKGGSKLVKVPGEDPIPNTDKQHKGNRTAKGLRGTGDLNSAKATPKVATVGGVKFYRTKNGNMYRSGIIKAHGYAESAFQHLPAADESYIRKPRVAKKIDEPCKTFTTTGIPFPLNPPMDLSVHRGGHFGLQLTPVSFLGSCLNGPRCRYNHDPSKVAVCREFLQKGSCPSGDSCDLSHELTPERTPTCMHFSKGNCSNPNCRYMHIRVSPSALVCRSFGIYGYCDKGANCTERHLHECPDFSNTGTCATRGCKLLHRHKASVMRSNTNRSDNSEEDEASDISSDGEEIDSDDVDSDDLDGEFEDDGMTDSDMPTQMDFVRL